MNGFYETINAFLESQPGMLWLCAILFLFSVVWGAIALKKAQKVDELIECCRDQSEYISGIIRINSKMSYGNQELAKISGDTKQDAENLRERNTKLLGANEMLADMVMDKAEIVGDIRVITSFACDECRRKKNECATCPIRAAHVLYVEPTQETDEDPWDKPDGSLPFRSCAWCEHAETCREDGGSEFLVPPADADDIDCHNFQFCENYAEEDSEKPDVCETACPTCTKNDICDKTAGSGYVPGPDGVCSNWEDAFPTIVDKKGVEVT